MKPFSTGKYQKMAEGYAMSSRILRIIENIIKNDELLQEFTVVPTEDNSKNKSPVLYEQHTIGLESWCIKHVYQYACSLLFDQRQLLFKKKLPLYKMEELNHLLIGVILINPEMGLFWNMKRELIEKDVITIEEELRFSKLVLTYKSKSYEVFSYRRWLLKKVVDKMAANNLQVPLHLFQNELAVIHMASEKSPNNYHSWNHRIWCMENIASDYSTISNIVLAELNYTEEWINNHVSEHAGYHYRQYLIKLVRKHKKIITVFEVYYNFVVKNLLNLVNDGEHDNLLIYLLGKPYRTQLLEENCSYINFVCLLLYDLFVIIIKVNQLFPEHESLYYHRKFLVYHLMKIPYEYHNIEYQKPKIMESNINLSDKNITNCDMIVNIHCSGESSSPPKIFKISNVSNCNLYELISNCEKTSSFQNNSVCARKYQKWLTHVIGFE